MLTQRQVIERMCLLMSRANNLVGWSHPADCICGESDDRRAAFKHSIEGKLLNMIDGNSNDYLNDGAALDEIERLIGEELKRKGGS